MKTLSIDLETYSEIDIKTAGAYRYINHHSFQILLFAYSEDYGPTTVVDLACGEKIPQYIVDAVTNPLITKTAYNAPFERTCLKKHFGRRMSPVQWECTMVLAAQMGLPLGLDAVSRAMKLPEDKAKMAEGKALIKYFCCPCKPTKTNGGRTRNMPWDDLEKWERFKEYNGRDVEAENYIRQRLENHRPIPLEQRFWQLDQRINDNGVPVDLLLVTNAIECDAQYKARLEEAAIKLTGMENPNSVTQIKAWLEEEEGISIDSLNKKAMPDVIKQLNGDTTKEFLEIRKELSKSSTKKYDSIIRCVCDDEKVRGLFQFYGANRTGRFAGRLVQVQNLPQNHLPDLAYARELVRAGKYDVLEMLYGSVSSTLSELIRTAFVPEPSCRFIVADFSAIEARVIAWFAGEQWVLDEFKGDGKIYEATASQMFGVPKELIKKGNKEYELRSRGKVATLALGYQGGPNALIAMGALENGMTEEELPRIVNLWRKANKNIVRWWGSLEEAAMEAVHDKTSATDAIGGIQFRFENYNLFADLPCGRSLCYCNAKMGVNRFDKASIAYEGMNQVTKKWGLQETYGGKLAENVVQATARDCLAHSMLALDSAGFDIRMHVHDEVIVNEPKAGRSVEEVCEIMGRPIPWAPDLPLRADGYETDFYRKD